MGTSLPSKKWRVLVPSVAGALFGIAGSLGVSAVVQRRQAAAGATAASSRVPLTGAELEKAKAEEQRRHEAVMAAFAAEKSDAAWSATASTALEAAFRRLEKSGDYRLVTVECKASSCLATFEWPSYEVASEKYGVAMHEILPVNCAREVRLDPPPERNQPYRGSMLMTRCQILTGDQASNG
jgi:hypothetical protein